MANPTEGIYFGFFDRVQLEEVMLHDNEAVCKLFWALLLALLCSESFSLVLQSEAWDGGQR